MSPKGEPRKLLDNLIAQNMYADREYQALMRKVGAFLDVINRNLRILGVKATAVIGGSFAKGTLLRDDFDCDVFVRFNEESDMVVLKDALRDFSPETVHGSRDYFVLHHAGIEFEVIPTLKVDKAEGAPNLTDMSYFHVQWMKDRIAQNPRLAQEVVLAKLFCKANNVYGAESYIRGFSGHVLDILVAYYGSFWNLVCASAKWKARTIIDFNNAHQGKALANLNKSKTESPLIVVDPIVDDRNASAAISNEKYASFIDTCKRFTKTPKKTYFEMKPLPWKRILARKNTFVVEGSSLPGSKDVSGSKIMKAFQFIGQRLKDNDFAVAEAEWEWDKRKTFRMYFTLKASRIPEQKEWPGPPLAEKRGCDAFKQKHAITYVRAKRLYATVTRPYPEARKLFSALMKEQYVTSRVQTVRLRA